MSACADEQAERAVQLVGELLTYRSFPMMGHSMHGQDPALFTGALTEWWFSGIRS